MDFVNAAQMLSIDTEIQLSHMILLYDNFVAKIKLPHEKIEWELFICDYLYSLLAKYCFNASAITPSIISGLCFSSKYSDRNLPLNLIGLILTS